MGGNRQQLHGEHASVIGSDDSTQAIVRRLDQNNVESMLRHFQRGGTWDTFTPGENAIYLEQIKMDLVALAHEVEARLVKYYQNKDLIDRA